MEYKKIGRLLALVAITLCGAGVPAAGVASAMHPPAVRVVDLTAPDRTVLKASYFAAAILGPGVLLLHQGNRDRSSWEAVARQLAAAGINTLTLDMRGFGESGGAPHQTLTPKEYSRMRREKWPGDVDTAFQFLIAQPGVDKNVIGVGGAGFDGVDGSVQAARRYTAQVKSLVFLSGETYGDGLQFLRQASQLPELFVVAQNDEYPPTVEAMELLYLNVSSPGRTFVRYPGEEAPWLGLEDRPGVPATGSHGTDVFKLHSELASMIVNWFVTTLIKTPGHAPPGEDAVAVVPSAPILKQIETPGGVEQVALKLAEARRHDPDAQLFPEVIVEIMGYDQLRAGETKSAIEIFKLDVTAYPRSPDAYDSLSDAYLADGQKDLALQYAEKALALLGSDTKDSKARREEIRDSAQQNLDQIAGTPR